MIQQLAMFMGIKRGAIAIEYDLIACGNVVAVYALGCDVNGHFEGV